MQLENLREFAARHRVPVNPDQPREGGEGSGIAQTFASQVALARCPLTPCRCPSANQLIGAPREPRKCFEHIAGSHNQTCWRLVPGSSSSILQLFPWRLLPLSTGFTPRAD